MPLTLATAVSLSLTLRRLRPRGLRRRALPAPGGAAAGLACARRSAAAPAVASVAASSAPAAAVAAARLARALAAAALVEPAADAPAVAAGRVRASAALSARPAVRARRRLERWPDGAPLSAAVSRRAAVRARPEPVDARHPSAPAAADAGPRARLAPADARPYARLCRWSAAASPVTAEPPRAAVELRRAAALSARAGAVATVSAHRGFRAPLQTRARPSADSSADPTAARSHVPARACRRRSPARSRPHARP